MKQNQFKIAIGVGVAFLAIITIVALWAGASNHSQRASQQASTSILSDIFGGRNNFNSYNRHRRNRRSNSFDNIHTLPVDPSDRKENLIWQKGGTCTDDGEGCSAKATCPSGYKVINCTNNSIVDNASNSNYTISITNDQKTCQAKFKVNSNPTNETYKLKALCLRENSYPVGYIGPPVSREGSNNSSGSGGYDGLSPTERSVVPNNDNIPDWHHNSDGSYVSPRTQEYPADYQQYLQDHEEFGSDL